MEDARLGRVASVPPPRPVSIHCHRSVAPHLHHHPHLHQPAASVSNIVSSVDRSLANRNNFNRINRNRHYGMWVASCRQKFNHVNNIVDLNEGDNVEFI